MDTSDYQSIKNQLERRNQEMTSMIEIGKVLTSTVGVREVTTAIMQQIESLLKPTAWSLLLTDQVTGELVFEIAISPIAEQLSQIRLKAGEGIAGWVAMHGEPLLIPDVACDDRFSAKFDKDFSFVTRSIICVPMKIKDRVIGVIELINSLDDLQFDSADMTLLSTIADFSAIALDNARNYDRINELVITDDVTGLYNSRHFTFLIDEELERSGRYKQEFSLIFLDLDHLKRINDLHGHLVGSRMLKELGLMIAAHIRKSDRAARYGGDEFVIIVPQTPKEQAAAMAVNLLERMRNSDLYSDDGVLIRLSASFGVASYPEDAQTRKELIAAADSAMYEAKNSGRGCVRVFGRESL